MVTSKVWHMRAVIHAFCVDCGAPVVAYCGSDRQYAVIRACAPVCGCRPDVLNKDGSGRQIWYKEVPGKDVFNATH